MLAWLLILAGPTFQTGWIGCNVAELCPTGVLMSVISLAFSSRREPELQLGRHLSASLETVVCPQLEHLGLLMRRYYAIARNNRCSIEH
jgi:hypothetical protein